MVTEICPHCHGAGGRYWEHESPPTYHLCEWCLGAGKMVLREDFDFRDAYWFEVCQHGKRTTEHCDECR